MGAQFGGDGQGPGAGCLAYGAKRRKHGLDSLGIVLVDVESDHEEEVCRRVITPQQGEEGVHAAGEADGPTLGPPGRLTAARQESAAGLFQAQVVGAAPPRGGERDIGVGAGSPGRVDPLGGHENGVGP